MFAPFNYIHFIFLAFIPILIFGFYFLFRNKGLKTQTIFLTLALGIAAASEIYDMFYQVPQLGWMSTLNELPLYMTDIDIGVVLVAVIRNYLGKKNPVLDIYLLFPVMMGTTVAILYLGFPANVYPWYHYRVISMAFSHTILFVSTILYFMFNKKAKTFNIDKCWGGLVIMEVSTVVAHIVNIILKVTGANPSANYGFTIDGPSMTIFQVAGRFLGGDVPYLRFLPTMLLTWFGITTVCWGTWRIIAFIVKKVKQNKAKKAAGNA